ncbi:hypothetical protein ASG47_10715 [Devosia sp. Leaf420]|uniref:hypothetical protein n=1 Tax=Devosia sp. Leaf420 TaxID=1736374 RepID=UPI0007141E1C|nr:hypothetical protein [Devosia sp. Leaf420]KQT47058.1 hypothetical protein ASG47_10715 [Devosia sp. Leaf420]
MNQRITDGADYLEHFGEIESLSPSEARKGISPLPTIKFTDGKIVHNVMVDSALAPFLQPGRTGRYLLSRLGRSMVVVGAHIEGEGYRVADQDMWHARKSRQLIFTLIFLLAALLLGGIAYFDDPTFGTMTLIAIALTIMSYLPYRASARVAALIDGLNRNGNAPVREDGPMSRSARQAEMLYASANS